MNEKHAHQLLWLFLVLALANLTADFTDWQMGIYLTKPLLLTTLSLWFYLQTKDNASAFTRFMLAGFIFSIGGDTLLMFVQSNGEHFFLLGLGSFLLAHLCYITAFLKFPFAEKGLVKRKPWTAVPLLIFLAGFSYFLWNDLPAAFKIPVVVYSFVITTMAICCLNMNGRVAGGIFKLLFSGALLFVFSDSLIALDKFKQMDVPHALVRLGIMATYLAGQFLLVKGSVMANQNAEAQRR